ncbi:MAG: bifunctional folylpolyglutamate synthase/dihydrofolate synthase [Alicyclobacillus sp.]|nr:bifunctional folylpolyglutamate synthase/dihydrofolate synthase [Alicyclobacillus sp.]
MDRLFSPATDAIAWVYQSYNRAKPYLRPGYDRDIRHPEWTRRILDQLGAPDKTAVNVAVTGSKGKGTHAILMAGMLQQAGLRTGLFTGPHLVDFMERFRINGKLMPESVFIQYIQQVRAIADTLAVPRDQYLGPVGLLAVVAALWFQEQHTDVNVFELGRGALHDDVNQLMHQGAVLTPVFLEHRRELGPTLADVAREKAGVIQPEVRWLVSHTQSPEVWSAVRERAGHGVSVDRLGYEFSYDVAGQTVHVQLGSVQGKVWLPDTHGFLPANTAVAWVAAFRLWQSLRPGVPWPQTLDLRRLRFPGRLDVVRTQPWVVVDGAIHGASARYVRQWAEHWRAAGGRGCIGAVLGLPTDKDGAGVLRELSPLLDWLIVARARNPHLHFDDRWLHLARSCCRDVQAASEFAAAWSLASARLGRDDLLLVVGTQSFVGDALSCLQADSSTLWRSADVPGWPQSQGFVAPVKKG